MFDILSLLPGKKNKTVSGWYSFNGVCCSNFGHQPDKRMRGGLKLDNNNFTYHCFNCQFKTSFKLGYPISYKTRQLLKWCNVEEIQIDYWNLESLRQKDILDFTNNIIKTKTLDFESIDIYKDIPNLEILDSNNKNHTHYIHYLKQRNIDVNSYVYFVTPSNDINNHNNNRNNNRIIIPYTYKDKIVGYTSRYLDNKTPKYINVSQSGYIFGYDFQLPHWQISIVTEGIFDSLSINGLALMHNTISDNQAQLLRSLNKKIIVVPDRDISGLNIIDKALENQFSVSIPNWHDDIKDVNDAVIRYGKFQTILSIIQSSTNNSVKINLLKRNLLKKLKV